MSKSLPVRDPRVRIPAAGAGVLQIGNMDEEISDWAGERLRPLRRR